MLIRQPECRAAVFVQVVFADDSSRCPTGLEKA